MNCASTVTEWAIMIMAVGGAMIVLSIGLVCAVLAYNLFKYVREGNDEG